MSFVSSCGNQVEYVVVKNPARAARTKMFDGSPLDDELKSIGGDHHHAALLSEIVKMNLAFLEPSTSAASRSTKSHWQRRIGMDIMARGMLQDWTGQMFNQYDRIAGRLLPTAEARRSTESRARLGRSAASAARAKVNFMRRRHQ